MQLHELNAGSRKKRKRVGRGPGSGLGKTCEQLTDGASLEMQQMLEMGLIRNTKTPVKLLGRGSLTKKIKITVDKASRGAVESVTQAGGEVIIPS